MRFDSVENALEHFDTKVLTTLEERTELNGLRMLSIAFRDTVTIQERRLEGVNKTIAELIHRLEGTSKKLSELVKSAVPALVLVRCIATCLYTIHLTVY